MIISGPFHFNKTQFHYMLGLSSCWTAMFIFFFSFFL